MRDWFGGGGREAPPVVGGAFGKAAPAVRRCAPGCLCVCEVNRSAAARSKWALLLPVVIRYYPQ